MLKTYYYLTKPGIIYGNDLSAFAGFMLAATRFGFHLGLLLELLIGMSLVIASACVFNNFIDRDIDQHMSRTKNRAFVTKRVPVLAGMIYATCLGVLGLLILLIFTNVLTTIIGLIGFFDYVLLYSPSKRKTVYSTLIGTVAGATPIVAGYTAVTNRLDTAALLLFLVLVTWQMPHFYAIAIRRLDEYKAAGLPVLPVKKGVKSTQRQMLSYIVAFVIATLLLTVFSYTGLTYTLIVAIAGLYWLYKGLQGYKETDSTLWARNMFLLSLVVLLVFCLMLILNFWLS